MAVGRSGKTVIEMDPALKRELYAALARDGLTMKEWFRQAAERYLRERRQPALPLAPTGSEL